MSDEALVAACATGETAALGALFDRHHLAVHRFLGRLTGTDHRDLDDLVQLTFVTALRAARHFDGRSAVRTWLLGVASNVARHHARAEGRRGRLRDAVAAAPAADVAAPDREVAEHERAARLHGAILALPPRLREALVLVYLEGIAGRDAAALLGIREGALWKRLHMARARLRGALEEAP
jgi:RNA polymerase sigma-70 factor (ECF subfamily)